jgi:hypothetical protein
MASDDDTAQSGGERMRDTRSSQALPPWSSAWSFMTVNVEWSCSVKVLAKGKGRISTGSSYSFISAGLYSYGK